MSMQPEIQSERLWQRFQTLAKFTVPGMPWTRRAFSPQFHEARHWLRKEFEAAGLRVQLDAAGNLCGRLEGSQPLRRPIVTGSHCDTVSRGGRFDGTLGVLAGLEVLQSLQEAGWVPRHPMEVIDFLAEEPTDHGVSCVGSRAFGGHLTPAMLELADATGETLAAAMRRAGARPDQLESCSRLRQGVAAFVELHIEQGPVLEAAQLPIGVVSRIVGIRRASVTVEGRADHAGTTPMPVRRDAMAGASVVIGAVRALADSYESSNAYVVATVGRLLAEPNAANTVAGRVELTLEVRSDSEGVLKDFVAHAMALCERELRRLQVRAEAKLLSATPPVACAPIVTRAIESAARSLDLPSRVMPSGAGHDAMHVASAGPIGMIFVPCLDGRSHCPEEWIAEAAVADGARVLARTMLALDEELSLDMASENSKERHAPESH